MLALFLRVDLPAVDDHGQRSGRSYTQPGPHTQFGYDTAFEAHGLGFDIASKETSFDLNAHSLILLRQVQYTLATVHSGLRNTHVKVIIVRTHALYFARNSSHRVDFI